jgi:hypothetical protein
VNPNPQPVYTEILSVNMSNINVKLFITGYDSLTTGYNEIFFKVLKDSIGQNRGHVRFYPKMWMTPRLWHSTPVCSTFTYDNSIGYYRGYAVFNMPTSPPILVWSSFITYQDEFGINYVSDSTPTYTSYHPEKQYRVFSDSTEQIKYHVTLVRPFSALKGLNDFWVILHSSDDIEQFFQQLIEPQMFISVYELDSLNQSTGNVSPVIGSDGIYKGKINLPYSGSWRVCDSIFYHGHFITNNPPPMPQFNFEVQ